MVNKEKVPVILVEGVAGYALYVNDRRVYGNKPWGGSLRTIFKANVPVDEINEAMGYDADGQKGSD